MPKNAPEKVAELYLRLNGFFVMSHFVMLRSSGHHKHIDLVALRPRGSRELINGASLEVDNKFFQKLGVDKDNENVAIVAEVRGGVCSGNVDLNEAYRYLKPVVGSDFEKNLKRVAFSLNSDTSTASEIINYNLRDCLSFIFKRIKGYREEKSGSWHLSEDFLGDLIYLHKLGFLEKK